MRLALLIALTTAGGLGACAPVPAYPYGESYGYTTVQPVPADPYGYYQPDYAPQPYYGGGYIAPGPAIIVGGERRFRDEDRYRSERPRYEGGYRGRPNPPSFGRNEPANFGGGRGGPGPAAPPPRPPPVSPGPSAPPGGGGGHDPGFNPANPTAHGDRG